MNVNSSYIKTSYSVNEIGFEEGIIGLKILPLSSLFRQCHLWTLRWNKHFDGIKYNNVLFSFKIKK